MNSYKSSKGPHSKNSSQNKENSELYAALEMFFTKSTDLMCIIDSNEYFQLLNPAWENVLGYSNEELKSKPYYEFIHPDDVQWTRELAEEDAKAGASVTSLINRYVAKNGSIVWLEWKASMFQDGISGCAVARDITEKVIADANSRNEKERFYRSFNLPLIGSAITSVDKQWLEVNSELQKMFGYTKEELNKLTWAELTHPEDLQKDVDQYYRLFTGEINKYSLEKRFIKKNGDIIWTIMSAGCVRKENGDVDYIVAKLQDITSRKKAELLLETSEERFRRVIDATEDIILRYGKNFKILYVNPSIKKFCKPSNDEVKDNSDESKAIEEITKALRTEIKNVFDKGKSDKVIKEMKCGDDEFVFQCFIVPDSDESGEITSVLTTLRDVTEIHRANEYIKEQAEFLDNIVKGASIGSWEWNIQTGDVKINERFAEILGYKRSELEPFNIDNWGKYLHTEDNKTAKAAIERILSNVTSEFRQESRMKHKNGKLVWVLDIGKVVKWSPVKKPLIMAGIIIDITVRKNAEKALKEQEKLFHDIFEIHDVIKIIIEPGTGNIFQANLAACKFYGYEKDELERMNIKDIFLVSDEDIRKMINNIKEEEIKEHRFKLKLSSGKVREAEVYSSQILKGERPLIFSIIIDVTDKNKAQHDLKESEMNLRKSNEEKDKLFSIIAHDLRGPLGSFMNLSELISESLPTLTREELSNFINIMKGSASSVYDLLDNLLEWSMVKRGMVEAEKKRSGLLNVLEPTLKNLKAEATAKEIKFNYSVPNNLTIFTDDRMLNIIIRNFGANAVKFTPHKGEINVTASKQNENEIIISVTDNGIGMSKDMIKDLFKIDAQTGRKGTDNEPTNGLGLILCKEFADKLNAKILISSEENNGSTFSIVLSEN
ncbi:MAG: PAS domain S-box protein [Ignavibacteria bacterium]